MARPKSDDRRTAILAAATAIIATEGPGATTAAIAKAAGVSNGSLFTYFDTKAALLNALYLDIKQEMAAAALGGMPDEADIRVQTRHMWSGWMHWAAASAGKRRALAHLNVAEDITAETREAGHRIMGGVAALLERSRANGPMKDAPLAFIVTLINALADATIDFMIADPTHAAQHADAAFDAVWRMLG